MKSWTKVVPTQRIELRMSRDFQSVGATQTGKNVIKMNAAGCDFTPSGFTSCCKTEDIIIY